MVGEHKILVVDDTEAVLELYSEWLDDNDVETATDGNRALEKVDREYDLVLIDREMPGPNGREVAIEMDEQGYDVHVVMVSSLPADFDLVEYPIDGYIQKPATQDEITSIVAQYRRQQEYHDALEEYFSLTSKLAAIEADRAESELKASDEYERLKRRVAEKRTEVDEAISESSTDWDFAFKTCGRAIEGTNASAEADSPNV